MRLVADESVDGPIVYRLREEGHDVWYIAEMEPGLSDDAVLELANREADLLVTADRDFGELVFRRRRPAPGIVLVRLAGVPPMAKAEIVSVALREHGAEMMRDRLAAPSRAGPIAVITRRSVRIRSRKD